MSHGFFVWSRSTTFQMFQSCNLLTSMPFQTPLVINIQAMPLLISKMKYLSSWKRHWRRNNQKIIAGFELTLLLLGVPPPCGTRYFASGAMHLTPWLAKAVDTFKIWILRSHFTLTEKEHRGLRDLCIFFSMIYVKPWIAALGAVKTPQNVLTLVQSLQTFSAIHKGISTLHMMGHLRFLL